MSRPRKPKHPRRTVPAPVVFPFAPPRWMVVGALAAGAAMAAPGAALPPLARPAAKAKPAILLSVDRYRGIADLDELALDAALDEGGSAAAASSPPTQPGVRFDVAAGPLGAALDAFALQSGIRVDLSPKDLRDIPSPGVAGVLSPFEALSRLLEGTGTEARWGARRSVRISLPGLHEEVEVTERGRTLPPRHTEPLVDTPQSITVVDAELLQAQGATSLRDALRNVTGISLQAGEGGGGLPGDNLAIRGFAARNDIFVDGVRDFGAYSRDPYNVEQVEVSKGPASAFSGRGSTGGAINLATKTPTLSEFALASATLGTDEFRRVTVDLNRPLPEGALGGSALRLNAMYTEGDTPGREAVASERHGVAASFAAGLQGDTRLWVGGSWIAEDNVPDYGIPWVPPTNVPLADHADEPAPVDHDNFYGLLDRDYEKTATTLATAVVEHDLADLGSGAKLRFLARGGRSERDSVITAPRFASPTSTDLNRQIQARDLADEILAGQGDLDLKLTTGAVEHAIVAGVELSRETAANVARTGPAAPLADLYDPDPRDPYTGVIAPTGARTENVAETAAAYVFDTMRFGEKFEAMAGVRFDRLENEFENRAATGETGRFGRADEMLSWRAGAVWKPRAEGSVYAAFGTSFNPSSEGNTGLSLTEATALLEPERSESLELGAKWELFDRRLLATAALFETEKTNARTPGINPGDPATVLEGQQRVRGFEVGLNGRISDAWLAFVGYTRLDSEVLESNVPAEVGKELANAPESSFSAWTSYRFRNGLELGAGAQFVDDRWSSPTNVRRAPAYWKFDASAAYDLHERLSLRVNLFNLADERYLDRVGGGHAIPGPGRSAAVTTNLKF